MTLKPPSDASKRQVYASRAAAALSQHPAVYKAWPVSELSKDADPIAALMLNNVYPGRSGDVAVALKPYMLPAWGHTGDAGSNHGTPWPYDRHVPVLLWGAGVTPAQIDQEVAVVDFVRTLSDKLGLPPDPHGGQPLP